MIFNRKLALWGVSSGARVGASVLQDGSCHTGTLLPEPVGAVLLAGPFGRGSARRRAAVHRSVDHAYEHDRRDDEHADPRRGRPHSGRSPG